MQFQEEDYQKEITVSELCSETACLYRNPADWRVLCEQFGIGDKISASVKDLSGGQRQRLENARIAQRKRTDNLFDFTFYG